MSSLEDFNKAIANGATAGAEYARQQSEAAHARRLHELFLEEQQRGEPYPLPFGLRALTQADKDELQTYMNLNG